MELVPDLCDVDSLQWTRPPSVVSTLDSVLLYLDDLLARERGDRGHPPESASSVRSPCADGPCDKQKIVRPVLGSITPPPPLIPADGRRRSISPPAALAPPRPVVAGDADDQLQRVMDLSFASVYEVKYPDQGECITDVFDVSDILTEEPCDADNGGDAGVDSGVETKSDATSISENETLHDYQNLSVVYRPGAAHRCHSVQSSNKGVGSLLVSRASSVSRPRSSASRLAPRNSCATNQRPSKWSKTEKKDKNKFYEICLGYMCHQLDGGDRRISIFSLQKHHDELSTCSQEQQQQQPHQQQHHHHHHQQQQQQQQQQPKQQSSKQQQQPPADKSTANSKNNGCSPSHQQPSTARSALRAGSEGSSSNQSQPPAATDRTSQRSASIETPVSSDPPSICVPSPNERAVNMGKVLKTLILFSAPSLIRDRKLGSRHYRHCLVGTEMIDWLLQQSPEVHSRAQAIAMWQVLVDDSILVPVTQEHQFKDKFVFYRFHDDVEREEALRKPGSDQVRDAQQRKEEIISQLIQLAPDAVLKAILRKPTHERTPEDLETIYEELVHIRALSHLSTTVKRELANVIVFESHPRAGTVLFNQGDEGTSWYVILKGSVNVVIHGKGTVTTLQDGDDFGQLALINNAPRAATIITREDGCQFLRVDKDDFNRILRDVEANTVRLKEHGRDVLVLEKVSANSSARHSHYKYTVMAGMPQKMLEHLLETRLDARHLSTRDEDIVRPYSSATDMFLDDFLLTHIMFMPTHQLITELMRNYRIESPTQDKEFVVASKSRVVNFVYQWVTTIRDPVFEEPITHSFFEQLHSEVHADARLYHTLREEAAMLDHVLELLADYRSQRQQGGPMACQTWTLPAGGQSVALFSAARKNSNENTATNVTTDKHRSIRADDDIIFRVYCADHTYCTLRQPVNATAETVKQSAADKLGLKHEDLVLVEVKSNGEKTVLNDNEVSIPTSLSINGRIFVSPKDHLDAMTALPDQEGPSEGTCNELEMFSTRELAYYITLIDWDLFCSLHEYELIYHVVGTQQFRRTKSNLDLFLRRFNEIQFWVVTEICLANTLGKRVQLLRKFIKLAAYCKEYQNLNAFFALVMGLSNGAVSRLTQTWERLPSKLRKMFTEFDGLIEPSRNHRAYRIAVGKLQPPIIPFMPLLLKDMTFTHEGNRTLLDSAGLVNFEKMHMLAQTMRTLRYCRSRQLLLQPPTPRSEQEVRNYIRNLRVIDNQRILTGLSQRLEPKRS